MVFPYQCSLLIPSLRNTISVQRSAYRKLALTSFPTYTPLPPPQSNRPSALGYKPPSPNPRKCVELKSVYHEVLKLNKKTQNQTSFSLAQNVF